MCIRDRLYFASHAAGGGAGGAGGAGDGGVDLAALMAKGAALLAVGYKKLASFESEGGGFEWFGASPGHEALTAYGVLQFRDMAEAAPALVDARMVERTTEWLLGRRASRQPPADGGDARAFARNPRSLDTFGAAPALVTDAYIVHALVAAGLGGRLAPEVAHLRATVAPREFDDPYVLALVAGTLYRLAALGDGGEDAAALRAEARALAERAAARQRAADGAVAGAATSITSSSGASLDAEATAVCVLAWLEEPAFFAPRVEAAMVWLAARCPRFGSTQATVLALKAIIAYDKYRASAAPEGVLVLRVDGAEAVSYTHLTLPTILLV